MVTAVPPRSGAWPVGSPRTKTGVPSKETESRSTSDPALIELASRPDAIVQEATRAAVSPDALEWLRNALAHGLHSTFLVGIVIAVVAFFVSLWFPPGSARELAERREHEGSVARGL